MSRFCIACAAVLALASAAAGSVQIVGCVHRADKQFPEYMPVWQEGWPPTDENGEKLRYASDTMPKGAYLHVYFRNLGTEPTQVRDLLLDGVSLTEAVVFSDSEIEYATQEMSTLYGSHAKGLYFNYEKRQVLSTRRDGKLCWRI